jgi:hypothetical protein
MNQDLRARTKQFALRIIRLGRILKLTRWRAYGPDETGLEC